MSELNLTIRLIFCLGLVLLELFLHLSVLLSAEGRGLDTYRQYDILESVLQLLLLHATGLRLSFKEMKSAARSPAFEGQGLEFMLPFGTNHDGFLLELKSVGVRALLPGMFEQFSHLLGI